MLTPSPRTPLSAASLAERLVLLFDAARVLERAVAYRERAAQREPRLAGQLLSLEAATGATSATTDAMTASERMLRARTAARVGAML
jgi:hypothetical protein